MKSAGIIVIFLLLAVAGSWAQTPNEDVIYLKNGGIMRGSILELVPGESVKLQTRDGNVFVYPMSEVARIAKEPVLEVERAAEEPAATEPLTPVRNKIESWYLYFALGYSHVEYPSPLNEVLEELSRHSTHASIGMDIPGIYAPLPDRKTLIGGVINAVGDRYEYNGTYLQVSQLTIGFSTMHFLTGEIGDGTFLRADFGLASMEFHQSGHSESSEEGLGFLFGGGYSIPVSSETRILLNLNYANRRIDEESYGAVSINVGVLL